MNRWLGSTILTLMFALLTISVAQAQDTVTLTGKVTTAADGLALPGATVTIPALKLSARRIRTWGSFPTQVILRSA